MSTASPSRAVVPAAALVAEMDLPESLVVAGFEVGPRDSVARALDRPLARDEPPALGTVVWVEANTANLPTVERLAGDGLLWAVVAWGLTESAVLRLLDLTDVRVVVGGGPDLVHRLVTFDELAREQERRRAAELVSLEDALAGAELDALGTGPSLRALPSGSSRYQP